LSNNKDKKGEQEGLSNVKFIIITIVFVILVFLLNYINKFSNEEYVVKHVIPESVGR